MTLVSSIIADAFRESNILALGKVPTANQITEALRLYNTLLASVYGTVEGERLSDWPLGNYGRDPNGQDNIALPPDDLLHHPWINARIVAVNEAALTVWFTPVPQDGSRMGIVDPFDRLATVPITINGNGRPIEGAASIVLNTAGLAREWIYRSDLGEWLKISGVVGTDENPFPQNFDVMFIALLAMRLNPRYGRTLDAQSATMLKENRQDFQARYVQSRPLDTDDSLSWPFMSAQGYYIQRGFSSQRAFNRGNYFGN